MYNWTGVVIDGKAKDLAVIHCYSQVSCTCHISLLFSCTCCSSYQVLFIVLINTGMKLLVFYNHSNYIVISGMCSYCYNRDNLFIPFVGALSGLTTLPMVMSFILALLSTGYSRNIIYFYHFEKCIGATFTILVSIS